MRRLLSSLAACLLLASAAHAQTALGVGDEVPKAFTALDSLEREATFKTLKGKEGLVLLFIRSADWCQYCKAQLRDWNEQTETLQELGYKLAAISYDAPAKLAAFEQVNELHYPLLSDANSSMIKAFGIVNQKFDEDSRFYGIPNPAIYIIDDKGKITHVFREADYKDRPSIQDVLGALTSPK